MNFLRKIRNNPIWKKARFWRLVSFSITLIGVALAITFSSLEVKNNSRIGKEFAGGLSVTMNVDMPKDRDTDKKKQEYLTQMASLIEERVNSLGTKSATVSASSARDSKIFVEIAGQTNTSRELIDTITSPNLISFRDIDGKELVSYNDLKPGEAKGEPDNNTGENGVTVKTNSTYNLYDRAKSLNSILITPPDPQKPMNQTLVVWIDYDTLLKESGTTPQNLLSWCVNGIPVTGLDNKQSYIQRPQCIGHLISYPKVEQSLLQPGAANGQFRITGSFTSTSASQLASKINSGTTAFKATLDSPSIVNPTYGKNALNRAVIAGVIALCVIGIFLIYWYRLLGVVSFISLSLYTVGTLLVYTLIKGEYGPDTIAALIIGIGMAVDVNIILFEKLKEYLYSGRTPEKSLRTASKSTIGTILDSNITTFIAAYVLFIFGKTQVKGFSMMLINSIFLTLIVTVIFTRILATMIIHSSVIQNRTWLLPVKKKYIPNHETNYSQKPLGFKKFNLFSKWSNILSIFSVGIILIGGILALTIGPNKSIEFASGSKFDLNLTKKQSDATPLAIYKDNFEKEFNLNLNVKDVYSQANDDGTITYVINTKSDIDVKKLSTSTTLKSIFGTDKFEDKITLSSISAAQAKEFVRSALLAVLFAILGIVIYIAVRFSFTFAIPAIIALVHDALWVVALMTFTRLEIDMTFVTAVLAIVGYSINDTVVTFSAIRKNYNRSMSVDSENIKTVVNYSIREVMGRSILTSFTTMLVVIVLLTAGPTATRVFNLTMLFGLVAGTYSSIFIATRLWVFLEVNYIKFRKKVVLNKKKKPNKMVVSKKEWPEEQVIRGIND